MGLKGICGDKIYLGSVLKSMRKSKHLTQKELSELSKVSYETISKLECGKKLPKYETLIMLLNALGYELLVRKVGE